MMKQKDNVENLFKEINTNIKNNASMNVFSVSIFTMIKADHYMILNVVNDKEVCVLQSFQKFYTLKDIKYFYKCYKPKRLKRLFKKLIGPIHQRRVKAAQDLMEYSFLEQKAKETIEDYFKSFSMFKYINLENIYSNICGPDCIDCKCSIFK